jgi:hypothetical protein
MIVAATIAIGIWRWAQDDGPAIEIGYATQLRNLPPNRWVKYHEERPGNWSRQGHAGIAYDSRRGTLLVFGSDTHGQDWDNAVHEFDPRRKRWETHQPVAGPETYRVDADGTPVAGTGAVRPWAMHTYDAIEYHPGLDALVVMSTTEHNPAPVPGMGRQPTWLYHLATRHWEPLANAGRAAPAFFGGSAAFDERRGVLVAYRHGLWELDAAQRTWRKASAETHHGMHHTMAYDSRRGASYVFGDYRATNDMWRYTPGASAGKQGSWTKLRPQGDPCPPYTTVPVAYDAAQDVFILMVDDATAGARSPAGSASTYLYDPDANAYRKLPGAELPRMGMNFMMAWDRRHEVALLVTGGWEGTVTVWALKARK